LQLFYGIKLQGSYEKIDTDKYNQSEYIDFHYDSYYDSTWVDTTTYRDTLPNIIEKNWQGSISLPLGMEYQLKDNLTLYCGFGYKITRKLVDYKHGDFYYWITNAYQSAGLKYNLLKKLELGLNLNGDLASFRGWQVEIRYLF
jgi:long-subunit fatty acid transport protein